MSSHSIKISLVHIEPSSQRAKNLTQCDRSTRHQVSPSSLSVSGPGVGEGTGLELTGSAGNWILLEAPQKKTHKGVIF